MYRKEEININYMSSNMVEKAHLVLFVSWVMCKITGAALHHCWNYSSDLFSAISEGKTNYFRYFNV